MSKRLMAALMVAIFLLGVALIMPAQAHHTIGRPTDTMPYRVRDNDEFEAGGVKGHVPGLTGYVWPGSGKDWYTGDLATGPGDLYEPPGYQSPWTTYPPGPPYPTWWQLRTNTYSPFGAILTSEGPGGFLNKGDLIFAINFTNPDAFNEELPDQVKYSKLEIFIPPEFVPPVNWEGGDASNIVVSTPYKVTVSVGRVDLKHAIAPNWWKITIEEDNADDVAFSFSKDNDYKEWYYVRVNAMGAPYIAGRYFFKMIANGNLPSDIIAAALKLHRFGAANAVNDDGSIRSALLTSDANSNNVPDLADFFPVENWPCLLVKGEVDPGIIEGVVYYGTWAGALYGERMQLPGVVRAVGVTPEGRHVEARGYFNASAKGHFEVEGVAPGTYTIYASAAGYPEQKVAEGVEVRAGKSVHLDIYLEPGVVVWGKVFSKHGMADVKWTAHVDQLDEVEENWVIKGDKEEGENEYVSPIMVEIYDSNDWPAPKPGYVWGDVNVGVLDDSLLFERGTPTDLVWTDEGYKPSKPGHLLSWSPINLWDEPYTSYGRENPLEPSPVAFPWESNPYDEWPAPAGDGQWENIFNGVGPPIVWWTRARTKEFEFKFGDKDFTNPAKPRIYGAPTGYDGHVPQLFATWTSGLKPGVYYVRVWTPNYVQTDVMGAYMDYRFEVAAEEWAGDVYVPIDLQLSGKIIKEVHFHDLPGEIVDRPIGGPDDYRWLIAEARDDEGNLVAFNFKKVERDKSSASILLWGFGWAGPNLSTDTPQWFFLYGYRHIRDYGIMPGTYKVYVYMRGYVQQEFESASVTLTGGTTYISNHMYRGAGINVTVLSKDWQRPTIFRPWLFPGEDVSVTVINAKTGDVMGTIKYWDGDSWETPETKEGEYMVPWLHGWGATWSKLKFNGSTRCEEDGPGGFVPDASYYRFGADRDWATNIGLETGEYSFKVSVKGYVFKNADMYTVYAAKGHQADTKLEVCIGANITATIIFKKESVIECTPFDMDMEVELYDEKGTLIGTAESYKIILCNDVDWEDVKKNLPFKDSIVGTWVPAGTKQVIVHWYGVDAYPNYDGVWWIEVDTWTKYDDFFGALDGNAGPWYPPVQGLLMGKDYHLIAGDPGYQGDAKAFNHLGPYEQRTKIRVPNTHLSGEASVIFELDRMGYLKGQVYGFNWNHELRPISWATVTASGEYGNFELYSVDGFYEGFLPAGTYSLKVEEYKGDLGHYSATASVNVPDGGSATYSFEGLELSGIPIPEFPVAAIALASALAASLYILRRSKK